MSDRKGELSSPFFGTVPALDWVDASYVVEYLNQKTTVCIRSMRNCCYLYERKTI